MRYLCAFVLLAVFVIVFFCSVTALRNARIFGRIGNFVVALCVSALSVLGLLPDLITRGDDAGHGLIPSILILYGSLGVLILVLVILSLLVRARRILLDMRCKRDGERPERDRGEGAIMQGLSSLDTQLSIRRPSAIPYKHLNLDRMHGIELALECVAPPSRCDTRELLRGMEDVPEAGTSERSITR